MKEKTILLSGVLITSFLGWMVYLEDPYSSNDQYEHPIPINTMSNSMVKIPLAEKSGVQALSQRKKDGLRCADNGKGCFCRDAHDNQYLTSKDQCDERANVATELPNKADASTLEGLQRQKRFIREIEAKRQEQQNASKLTTSIFVVYPSRCPQYASEIRRQNSKIIECVMQ